MLCGIDSFLIYYEIICFYYEIASTTIATCRDNSLSGTCESRYAALRFLRVILDEQVISRPAIVLSMSTVYITELYNLSIALSFGRMCYRQCNIFLETWKSVQYRVL